MVNLHGSGKIDRMNTQTFPLPPAKVQAHADTNGVPPEQKELTEAGLAAFDLQRARDRRDPAHERREQDRRERVAMSEIPNWFRHNQGA